MGKRIKKILLFLWRMLYPLVIYHLTVSVVIIAGVAAVVWYNSMNGATMMHSGLFYDLSFQLSLPLSALGALVAMVPLGLLYVLFRMERENAHTSHETGGMGGNGCIGGNGGMDGNSGVVGTVMDPKEKARKEPVHLKLGIRAYMQMAALGFAMCLFANSMLLSLPFSWDSFEEVSELLYTPSLPVQLLCVGLVVPFAEELVFRGLGYAKMRMLVSAAPAMVISSVYFGIYHGNLVQGIYAVILGFVMAWVMECYDALSAAYVLHASANIMSILVSNTIVGALMGVFAVVRWGLILICGSISMFIVYKMRKDKIDYEASLNCNSLL